MSLGQICDIIETLIIFPEYNIYLIISFLPCLKAK